MEGVWSAQVQAQNKHSRGLKDRPHLEAAFADINIAKERSGYAIREAAKIALTWCVAQNLGL